VATAQQKHKSVAEADRFVKQKGKRLLTMSALWSAPVTAGWVAVFTGRLNESAATYLGCVLTLICGALGFCFYFGYRDLRLPGVLSFVQATGPQSVNEVNSILDRSMPSISAGTAQLTNDWLVDVKKGRLVAIRFQDIIWVHTIDRSMSHGIDSYPAQFTAHTRTQSVAIDLSAADAQRLLAFVLPLCSKAKIGYDSELNNLFWARRKVAVCRLAEKNFPYANGAANHSTAHHSSAHQTRSTTGSGPRSQPRATSNYNFPVLDGANVIVTFASQFPMICPCCGAAARNHVKVRVDYRSAEDRLWDVIGLVTLISGWFYRRGGKSAYIRVWTCDSCPKQKRFESRVAFGGIALGTVGVIAHIWQAKRSPDFILSMVSLRFALAVAIIIGFDWWRSTTNLVQVGGMDATTITLVRTHKDFRAVLPNLLRPTSHSD
jgi:hypothetical protein